MAEVSRSETIQMLDGVALFAGLNKRQLAAVAKVVDHMTFEPGAALVKELEVGRRLIIIRDGTAEVRRLGSGVADEPETGRGAGRRIATVGPGDVVGELSLIDGKPTSASVIADTTVEALVLYKTRLTKLLASTPQLYPGLLAGLASRIRQLDRVGDLTG
jgi:CRP/FNR family transcriptional regulator, cyclic AMP receptor protein